tara:strand:+ start:10792 stop:11391 length:600 start_codon:yes stop_codon:yes gene_type:complete
MEYLVKECYKDKDSNLHFDGLLEVEINPFLDSRGYVFEPWSDIDLNCNKIINSYYPDGLSFVQELQSGSPRNTIRGLHYQLPEFPMAKMFRCISGRVLAVAVDLREGSETYMKHYSVKLTPESFKQFFVPVGFAFGFSVLSNYAEVLYKQTGKYSKPHNMCLLYSSEILGIDWFVTDPILSSQDKNALDAKFYKSVFNI